jgi:hypothetical protein
MVEVVRLLLGGAVIGGLMVWLGTVDLRARDASFPRPGWPRGRNDPIARFGFRYIADTEIFTPKLPRTLSKVSKRGFAPGESALYKLFRPKPAVSAIALIPRALATCPIAARKTSGFESSNAAVRYSAITSSSSRNSLGSNGLNFAMVSEAAMPRVAQP